MASYAYPSSSGPSAETYRASPTGSHVSLPAVNLPPFRTIDGNNAQQRPLHSPSSQHRVGSQHSPGQATQQQQVTSGQTGMGSPLPPPPGAALPPSYYHNPGQSLPPPPAQQQMNVMADPAQPHRYPLPPAGVAMGMSGVRHKKEIKRRTKTGCLTCRKRRIKVSVPHTTPSTSAWKAGVNARCSMPAPVAVHGLVMACRWRREGEEEANE